MPFQRPTIGQLRDRAGSAFEAALPGADARSRRSVEGALARVVAHAGHDLHGHLDWLSRQIHVLSCDDATILERHATLWGIARRPAAPAGGTVGINGTVGAVLPAGAELRRADQRRYRVVADITIGGDGTGTGLVLAVAAGAAGNADAGTTLTLISPAPGVRAAAVVAAGGLGGGADIEPVDQLRARILERIQSPPHGGRAADYHTWAKGVPGVTRAWIYPLWLGAGTVGVTFVCDDAAYGPAPSDTDLAAVAAAIGAEQPVTAAVTVFAPALNPLNITLGIKPDTEATRAAVTAAFADFVRREAVPGGALYLSQLRAELSAADGEIRHQLTLPAADVVSAAGHLAVPGVITWSAYP